MNTRRPTVFDYVFLGKLLVPYCDGCLSCVRVGEESCPEYATIGPIARMMDAADGLVLGAPVHTFAVTGLMKNFVEYFMYKRNRPSFFGKKAIVTCTASGGGHKGVLEFLEGTAYAKHTAVVQTGEMVDAPPTPEGRAMINHINWWYKPFYFRHLEQLLMEGHDTYDELLPLKHYYHRFTRSIFWEIEDMIPFASHPFYRFFWGWLGAPEVRATALAF